MGISLCCCFCLEHEVVRHEKDVPLTKPGKHSCILFCIFILKMLFKEIVKYNCIWQMSKPWPWDPFWCIECSWQIAQNILVMLVVILRYRYMYISKVKFLLLTEAEFHWCQRHMSAKNLNCFLKLVTLNGSSFLIICGVPPFIWTSQKD